MAEGGYPQDAVTNVINVQWAGGGVFVTADDNANVFCLTLDGDDATWNNLGTLDFFQFGDMFTGRPSAASFANVTAGDTTTPTFVIVGGGGSSNAIGLIMASHDGKTWTRVFSFGESSDTFTGANIFGVVWNEDDKAFYAGGHQSDNGIDPDPDDRGIFFLAETDVLFKSANGYSWSEVSRHETRWRVDEEPAEYLTGLLEPHCSSLVLDDNGNKVPDGIYGDDDDAHVVVKPAKIPAIDYFFGITDTNFEIDGVAVVHSGGGAAPAYPGTEFPTTAVAFAGGEWVAVGGDGSREAARLKLAVTEVGQPPEYVWGDISPPAAGGEEDIQPLRFIVGGVL